MRVLKRLERRQEYSFMVINQPKELKGTALNFESNAIRGTKRMGKDGLQEVGPVDLRAIYPKLGL